MNAADRFKITKIEAIAAGVQSMLDLLGQAHAAFDRGDMPMFLCYLAAASQAEQQVYRISRMQKPDNYEAPKNAAV